jgi:hypothetical protein
MVYVIYDVWTSNKRFSDGQKILWTVLALLLNILTAIVYYFLYKRDKR